MAARDRYKIDVMCPKCGAIGVLHVSENDYPFMKRLDKTIDSVEGNFSVNMSGESDIKLTCVNCGENFIE